MENIKSYVENDVYDVLKTRFLRQGKGRKPDVTLDIPLTNMTLLQLHFLMIEGSKTNEKMAQWFTYLYPASSYPPDRIDRMALRILEKATKITHPTELEHFLASMVHLDKVSDTLVSMSLDRQSLLNPDQWQYSGPYQITNQIIVDLENVRRYDGVGVDFSARWLLRLFDQDETKESLTVAKKVINKVKQQKDKLGKSVKKDPEPLKTYMSEKVTLPSKVAPSSSNQNSKPPVTASKGKGTSKDSKVEIKLREDVASLKSELTLIQGLYFEKNKENKVLQEHIDSSKVREEKLEAKIEENNSVIDDKNDIIMKLTNKIKNINRQPKEQEVTSYESVRVENYRLRKRCTTKDDRIVRLEEEIEALNEELLKMDGTTSVNLKVDGQYTDDVRLAVWELQGEGNVSASNCRKVIKIVAERIFHRTFKDDYPCTQTCLNIMDEGRFVALKQLGTVLSETPFTLHFDGTSRDGKKYVGVQASVRDGSSYSLGFQTVAKEDADTMIDLAVGLVTEIVDSHDEEKEVLTKRIVENLTSLMTDRAAVMKCFGQKLIEYLKGEGKTTVMKLLHCNAHFLLGVSSEVEKGLKEIEKDLCLGRDNLTKFRGWSNQGESPTARVIRTTCDILGPRGDEKNGCRNEWLAFCQENRLVSKIPSYRGNRFNCFFEAAATIIHHRHDIILFLTTSLGRTLNMKLESVLADLKDPTIVSHLLCVSFLYLHLTNPYWEVINKGISYEEFVTFVNSFHNNFREHQLRPLRLTCFSNVSHSNPNIVKSIQCQSELSLKESAASVETVLKELSERVIVVTERQLVDFLEGGSFFDLGEADKKILQGCPITNLLGENAFGDLDFDFQKKRHASLHHRSAVHMIRKNQTVEWVATRKDNISLMSEARKMGPILRKKHRLHEQQVLKALRERQLQNEKAMKERELKLVKLKEDIATRVHAHGGPCLTSKDVVSLKERVESRTKFVEALKDEVRYIKQVIGKVCNVKLSCARFELEKSLRQYLSPEEDVVVKSPPKKRQKYVDSVSSNEEIEEEESRNVDLEDENDGVVDITNFAFEFGVQGQWVAVFYDNCFYIGQVIHISSPNRATVKFLMECVARPSCYKWPQMEDIAEIEAKFVFSWDFDVVPTAGGRLWEVPSSRNIKTSYQRLKDITTPQD